MAKADVVTIHGVNPNRQWQKNVGEVLRPHFNCVDCAYDDYDTPLGPLRAIFNLPLLTFSFALLLWGFVRDGEGYAYSLWFASLIIFIGSVLLAWRRRVKCAKALKAFIDERCPLGRPHVVAHSLGTYLVGFIVRTFPDFRWGRLVLVSAVLPIKFPWQNIISQRPACFHAVRSEYGTSDLVSKVVAHLGWLAPGLGGSGAYGFANLENCVHTTVGPTAICSACDPTRPTPVHNVPLAGFEHSDHFLGHRHARELWLPYLWGYGPAEFAAYCDACQLAESYQADHIWTEANSAVDRIWSTSFSWTNLAPMGAFVRESIQVRVGKGSGLRTGATVQQIEDETKSLLHVLTTQALLESVKTNGRDDALVRQLHPKIAIAALVHDIVSKHEISASP